jgi:hypothetical protein
MLVPSSVLIAASRAAVRLALLLLLLLLPLKLLLPPAWKPPARSRLCCRLELREARYMLRLAAAVAAAASLAAPAGLCRSSSDWLVLGRHTSPEVSGPVAVLVKDEALLLLRPALPVLAAVNSCCGTTPLRDALPPPPLLLLLLPPPLLLARTMRWLP